MNQTQQSPSQLPRQPEETNDQVFRTHDLKAWDYVNNYACGNLPKRMFRLRTYQDQKGNMQARN